MSLTASVSACNSVLRRAANPAYNAAELEYQLSTTKSVNIIVHPTFLPAAVEAASKCGIPAERIILLDDSQPSKSKGVHPHVNDLIAYGLSQKPNFVERRLAKGEAKTKLAFLSFSSGTTGKPKVRLVSGNGVCAA